LKKIRNKLKFKREFTLVRWFKDGILLIIDVVFFIFFGVDKDMSYSLNMVYLSWITSTPIMAEISALVKGLRLAILHNLTPLEVSIDCEEIIKYLKDDHPPYYNILFDCRHLIKQLGRLWCSITIGKRTKWKIS